MTRGLWEKFPSRLKTVDEAPEPLRGAMLASLKPDDEIHLLVFGPASKHLETFSPATLLAILEREWILVAGTEQLPVEMRRCEFDDTLLVEQTSVLLMGKLRFDFVAEGRAQTVAIHFNTTTEGLYQEAAQLVLNGMDDVSEITPDDGTEFRAAFKSLPLKFYNAVMEFLPMGQRLIGFVHWPAVLGRKLKIFRQELAPEAVLILTGRDLVFIAEEKSWSWIRPGRIQKYGNVVTYCPLSRLKSIGLSKHDSLETIDVDISAGKTGERLKINFPDESKADVSAFLELALRHQ